MNASALQLLSQAVGTFLRIGESLSGLNVSQFSILSKRIAKKSNNSVQCVTALFKLLALTGESNRFHNHLYELANARSMSIPILSGCECIVEPFPFRHGRVGIIDAELPEQVTDLRAGQAFLRVCKHPADGFELIAANRWNYCHVNLRLFMGFPNKLAAGPSRAKLRPRYRLILYDLIGIRSIEKMYMNQWV